MPTLTTIPLTGLSNDVVTQIQSGGGIPKISSIDYPGNDTAANPDGGQTITINGANFSASSTVYVAGNPASIVGFVDANTLTFQAPSATPGVVSLYVVNADGGTAIAVPGLLYSGTPTWTTASGTLGSPYEADSFSVQLQASGDAPVTFAVSSGNTIPSGLTLAANGLLSGTIPATDPTTTYTFYVDAIDGQNQETARSFSVTYTKDAVTWSSPANGAAYAWSTGAANTVSLSATSAAGKSITYSVQSGTLPANVSISGSDITGTPNTAQANTEVVIRATAADTNRFADRTLHFVITAVSNFLMSVQPSSYSNTTYDYNGYYTNMGVDSSNNIIVTTALYPDGDTKLNLYIFKMNSSGEIAWAKRIQNPSTFAAPIGKKIATDPDGNIYIWYVHTYGGTNSAAVLLKLSSEGAVIWQKLFSSSGSIYAVTGLTGGVAYAGGYVYVMAYGAYTGIGNVPWLGKIDATTGNLVVGRDIRTIQTGYNSVRLLDIHATNTHIYIAGSAAANNYDGVIFKAPISMNVGDLTWHKSPNNVVAGSNAVGGGILSVVVDQSDNVYIAGYRAYSPIKFNSDQMPYVAKLDSSGNLQWINYWGANVSVGQYGWNAGDSDGSYYSRINIDTSSNTVSVSTIAPVANSTTNSSVQSVFTVIFDYAGNVVNKFQTYSNSAIQPAVGEMTRKIGNTIFGWMQIETNSDSLTKPIIFTASSNATSNATTTLNNTLITSIANTPTLTVVANTMTFSSWNNSNYGYYIDTNPPWPTWGAASISISNVSLSNTKVSF